MKESTVLGYKNWLKSKSNKPKGTPDIKEQEGYPAYYLSPEDIATYINSLTPLDLYAKPNDQPFFMDYPTTAVNIREPLWSNQDKNVTALFPNRNEAVKYGLNTDWTNSTEEAQGVYEHEVAHAKDPRSNPYKMWSFPNHGLITWQGLSGEVLQREFPAMVAEEIYRNSILGRKK